MSIKKNTNQDDMIAVRDAVSQNRGGKEVIARILEAYGFSTRIALCKQLGVSQSTMANRYARDTFPADWVMICHLETGASLVWLSTGNGSKFIEGKDSNVFSLRHIDITNGSMTLLRDLQFDRAMIPDGLSKPFMVSFDKTSYLADTYDGELVDGVWFIEIDGISSVRQIYRFPAGRARIENGRASFDCHISEIKVLGKIITKTEFIG